MTSGLSVSPLLCTDINMGKLPESTKTSQWRKKAAAEFYVPTAFLDFPSGDSDKEPACQCRRCVFDLWARSPGGGHGNPLQYSCLENPTDRTLVGYSPSMGLQRVAYGWSNLACTHCVFNSEMFMKEQHHLNMAHNDSILCLFVKTTACVEISGIFRPIVSPWGLCKILSFY